MLSLTDGRLIAYGNRQNSTQIYIQISELRQETSNSQNVQQFQPKK